ncbi:hypothetical protein F4813DRAFT_50503 [Daldinia decipiens]|uniref:uncharacterized protein n=1 Tax=Daldinia decipiens TaxID=326647 RepID=UPI0020C57BEA|nr:uncharacterized protein F4813DRAFT_50503 [Daldinia decipiens]KAI1658484.1 hypothetical protein F4813DRAFT_50503 [Daldinia decipiens]
MLTEPPNLHVRQFIWLVLAALHPTSTDATVGGSVDAHVIDGISDLTLAIFTNISGRLDMPYSRSMYVSRSWT